MNNEQKLDKEKMMGKAVRILTAILIIVISICVCSVKVPKLEYMTSSIEKLDESRDRVMRFSAATLTASTAISLLPNDWANPLANSLADMNKYFVFIFAVIFLEKLIVIEGIEISFIYVIPVACALYILFVLFQKEKMKEWAIKLGILGISMICVIPFSIHFTEKISKDYMAYIETTIEEANAGAEKIYEVKSENEDEESFLDKVSDVFITAFQGITDLFTYFNNMIKRCINSIAIMLVITFVLPMLILVFFKWLLKELFSLNLNISIPQIRMPHSEKNKKVSQIVNKSEDEKDISNSSDKD